MQETGTYVKKATCTVLSTAFRKSFFVWCFTQKNQICKLLLCFKAKPIFVTTMPKTIYSSHWFLNNQIILRFPKVQMNANNAENFGVGNLEAEFQHVPLAHFFLQGRSQGVRFICIRRVTLTL